ncbi:MAG: glycosyltransferase family 39 protein [Vulcanimicrobiaceae bacterium]
MRSRVLIALALVAVALGVFFRFFGLDHKVYGGDEVYSSLRMFGDTEAQLVRVAPHFHDAHDLWLVLHPSPSAGSSDWLAPARVLAAEEPQHPPVYYELAHFWVGAFGNSIATTRLLSAFLSLLALPCAFWLALELYGSRRAGWIALALVALSPVQVLYAQQAREYALWSAAILALSAAVLRAVRCNATSTWALVGVLFAFGLYVFPLTLAIGCGLALGAFAISPRRSVMVPCGLAFGAGLIAYAPWLVILFAKRHTISVGIGSSLANRLPPLEVLRAFAGGLRLNFLDLGFERSSALGAATTTAVLIVIALALVFVARRYPARVSLFVLLPLLVSSLALVLPDLIFVGQHVRTFRYFMPVILFVDLAVVGLLTSTTSAASRSRAVLAFVALVAILGARVLSCVASARADTWWSDSWDSTIAVAQTINREPQPLLVSDNLLMFSLALSNYLRPDVAVALRPRCYLCTGRGLPLFATDNVPRGYFTTVFALGPSAQLQRLVQVEIGARDAQERYRCINVFRNCTSDINVLPLVAGVREDSRGAATRSGP